MNNYKIISALLLLAFLLGNSGCEKYIGDVNVNPNEPSEVVSSTLLSGAQGTLAYTLGGDMSRYLSIFTRHVHGETRQFAVIQRYGISTTDVNTTWRNLYANTLKEVVILKSQADTDGQKHYGGVARIMEAHCLMLLTDYFGDIPYTEAFLGIENLSPKYDAQESIYTQIFLLLEEAQALLAQDDDFVLEGDIVYGGSVAAWVKFGHVLAARGYLHLSKTSTTNYQKALDELAIAKFESGADDALFAFGETPPEQSPWYQYNDQRNDIITEELHIALLNDLEDPRDSIFGAPLNTDHPLFVKSYAVPLISFSEQEFIRAECLLQTGAAESEVRTAYLSGIEASFAELSAVFTKFGVNSMDAYDNYIQQAAINPSTPITLEHIMTQKYVALFTRPEVFNDWKRTGIPTLVPNTGSEIPRRLPYPEQEVLNNTSTPKGMTIFDRVWWDM